MKHVGWQTWPRAHALAACTLAAWAWALGCSPFPNTGSQDSPLRVDAGPVPALGECVLRHPPGPPPADVDDSDGEPTITLVAYRVDYGDWPGENGRPSHETNGFDLDGVCTREPSSHACSVPDWAMPSASRAVDGVDGIDNGIGAAFFLLSQAGSPSATYAGNLHVSNGNYSYLIQISGYNGAAEDPKVTVAVADVTLLRPPHAESARPTWLGTDEWLGVHHFFELDRPAEDYGPWDLPPFKYVDEDAYVTGHQLVARMPRVYSGFGTFTDFQLVGRLVRHPELGWKLEDGNVAARAPIDMLLWLIGASLGVEVADAPAGKPSLDVTPVCTDHPMYAARKRIACSLVDISYDGPDARSSLCDGVSWGWRFDASPARLVGVRNVEPAQACPEGSRPGIDDHCAPSDAGPGAP